MTGPAAPVAAIRTAVRDALADLPPGALVLVGCSGGPDSLALAAATGFVAPRAGLRAGAVVVDHGLQPGSARVAAAAAAACRGLGLDPVDVAGVDATPSGQGPEAAARQARYAALDAAAARHAASAVLLGHTLDDQAETVLLGLARGSGGRSLAGMDAVDGLRRRPLLGLTRATTVAACAALGLEPWADPTNTDPAQPRARVRRSALPALEEAVGPGVAAALARTADLLREDADALDALAEDLAARAAAPADRPHTADDSGADPTGWDVAVLAAAPAALRHRVLRRAALAAGSPAGSLSRRHVLALDALVTAWHGQGPVHLPGRVAGARRCGRLTIARAPEEQPPRAVSERTL